MKNNNGTFSFFLLAMLLLSLVLGLMLMETFTGGTMLQKDVPAALQLRKTEFSDHFPSIFF